MIQIRKVIEMAAARIGAVNFGEPIDAFTSQLLLENFRYVLQEMSIRSFNYKQYNKSCAGKNEILIGVDSTTSTSGDIIERPATISDVIVNINGVNYPQYIKPFEDYYTISIPNVNAIPREVYISYTKPFIILKFYPGFGGSGTVQVLGRSYLVTEDATINDYLDVPSEYHLGLVTNLALKSAGYFGLTPDQSLIIEASSALKHITQDQIVKNIPTPKQDLQITFPAFNAYSGGY